MEESKPLASHLSNDLKIKMGLNWILDTTVEVTFMGRSSNSTSENISFSNGSETYTIALGVDRTSNTKMRYIYLKLVDGPAIWPECEYRIELDLETYLPLSTKRLEASMKWGGEFAPESGNFSGAGQPSKTRQFHGFSVTGENWPVYRSKSVRLMVRLVDVDVDVVSRKRKKVD